MMALWLALALAFSHSAEAATHYVRFCFQWDINYTDNGTGYDDYFTTDTPQIARGAYWQITEIGVSSHTGYADDSGAYAGCTPLQAVDSSAHYNVIVFSKAKVNGNNIVDERDNDASTVPYGDLLWNAWSPPSSGTFTKETVTSGGWVNIIAAASYTIYRHNGGMTGQTYTVYNKGQDLGTPGCNTAATGGATQHCEGKVYIGPGDTANHKYIISHETGHAMAYRANGELNFSGNAFAAQTLDCKWGDDTANTHAMVSVEYQSLAAYEGLAHFVAASTYNSTGDNDCWFNYYHDVDWDGDTHIDGITWADCEGNDHCDNSGELCGPIAVTDHLETVCGLASNENRGVEYDWLRFWWDFTTDEAVSFDTIMDIWDGANPNDWEPADGDEDEEPAQRFQDAAYDEGLLTEWNTWAAYEGVDN